MKKNIREKNMPEITNIPHSFFPLLFFHPCEYYQKCVCVLYNMKRKIHSKLYVCICYIFECSQPSGILKPPLPPLFSLQAYGQVYLVSVGVYVCVLARASPDREKEIIPSSTTTSSSSSSSFKTFKREINLTPLYFKASGIITRMRCLSQNPGKELLLSTHMCIIQYWEGKLVCTSTIRSLLWIKETRVRCKREQTPRVRKGIFFEVLLLLETSHLPSSKRLILSKPSFLTLRIIVGSTISPLRNMASGFGSF